jgi:hypothetical protein
MPNNSANASPTGDTWKYQNTRLDPQSLDISDRQLHDLVEFLKSLTDESFIRNPNFQIRGSSATTENWALLTR